MGLSDRLVLSDAAWERMAPLIIGRADQQGSTGRDNRMFVEGVLWIVRTGFPWRADPPCPDRWAARWLRAGLRADRRMARRCRHGRRRLRRRSIPPSHRGQGRHRRHSEGPVPPPPIPARQAPLCTAPPDRVVPLQTQAVPPRRHACEKTAGDHPSVVTLAATIPWLRQVSTRPSGPPHASRSVPARRGTTATPDRPVRPA